ncbi:unnamed protein product [Darwinula stevensoni]|uniref:Saccharopine dehydrogenase n=1 Tax=Darwinula stevensoni TaxID=69355 RepID=A0A7R8ZYC2_9CRUS|nr:unnamed protein product [Darwinula stevensoni]CAG0881211.1 unnamed protein product [Darwinula stevensoni]
MEKELVKIAEKYPDSSVATEVVDVSKDRRIIRERIRESNLCICLLPDEFTADMARICIEESTHFISAMYVDPNVEAFDDVAREKKLVILNEVGLDPGLDHMLAMKTIERAREEGCEVDEFISYCGGIPAASSVDPGDLLKYKFSWSPRTAVYFLRRLATYLQDGEVRIGRQLWGCFVDFVSDASFGGATREISSKVSEELRDLVIVEIDIGDRSAGRRTDGPRRAVLDDLDLEVFPNGDSLSCEKEYGLHPGSRTLRRGTLRYRGFSHGIKALQNIGLFDLSGPKEIPSVQIAWREYLCLLHGLPVQTPQDALEGHLSMILSGDAHQLAVLRSLGLTTDTPVVPGPSPLDTLAGHLEKCLTYREGERDMVVLYIEARGRGRRFQSHLVTEGDSKWSAMAKTVGIPIATAAELILEGKVQETGVIRPITDDFIRPTLQALEREGIAIMSSEL